ncbi:hypothetical protein H8356DRAFT_1431230 [Neocallimastix lanati (nom. inval.)]|nr:hypothetical protein H8356DRAFT_1431230 [Neocallimastix sp. JGI-2020a]
MICSSPFRTGLSTGCYVVDLIIIWVWRKGKGVIMAQFQCSCKAYTERVTSSISIGWHGCYLAKHVYWSYFCLGIWSADVVLISINESTVFLNPETIWQRIQSKSDTFKK